MMQLNFDREFIEPHLTCDHLHILAFHQTTRS